MQISETGCSEEGFTLIELLVVLSIILLFTTVAIPALFRTGTEGLLREGRQIAALSSYLSSLSAIRRMEIRLYYDLTNGTYWAERADGREWPKGTLARRFRLPEDISFLEIRVGGEVRRGGGMIYTLFTPWGYRDRTTIYLSYKGEVLTILIPSFGGSIKIQRGYIRSDTL